MIIQEKEMKQSINLEQLTGVRGHVESDGDDLVQHDFNGLCIGIRNGFLQVQDMEDNIFDIDTSQFTPYERN